MPREIEKVYGQDVVKLYLDLKTNGYDQEAIDNFIKKESRIERICSNAFINLIAISPFLVTISYPIYSNRLPAWITDYVTNTLKNPNNVDEGTILSMIGGLMTIALFVILSSIESVSKIGY